jgi:ribosomal protein L3 glutamine methyltransferase
MGTAAHDLETLRDWLRYAVSRFGEAALAFGHGTTNAYDEAAYLLLHALHLPLDRLDPFLDARLTQPSARGWPNFSNGASIGACRRRI